MAYVVNKTDGTVLLNIQEGEVDSTYGLNLLGKNYLGYGELIAENFVRLLENFASDVEPSNPIEGQLWFSIPPEFTSGTPYQLKVWNKAGGWKPLAHMFVGDMPSLALRGLGDLWFDNSPDVNAIKYWNGEKWVNLSMLYGAAGEETGIIVDEPIRDAVDNPGTPATPKFHKCIKFLVNGELMAVFSADAEYTPHPDENLTAFCGGVPGVDLGSGDYNQTGKIGKGLNLNSSNDFKLRGVAIEAEFADVAEIYIGDAAYEPGTLVGLGGSAEITATQRDADTSVFGVVSTKPAYLMNARKKNVKNALPIAVAGRIPVMVKGPITRGDRLVASDVPGVARRATEQDPMWSVIGRALQDHSGDGIAKIESSIGAR